MVRYSISCGAPMRVIDIRQGQRDFFERPDRPGCQGRKKPLGPMEFNRLPNEPIANVNRLNLLEFFCQKSGQDAAIQPSAHEDTYLPSLSDVEPTLNTLQETLLH